MKHFYITFIGIAYILSMHCLLSNNLSLFLHTLIQFWSYPLHSGLTYPVRQRQSDLSS